MRYRRLFPVGFITGACLLAFASVVNGQASGPQPLSLEQLRTPQASVELRREAAQSMAGQRAALEQARAEGDEREVDEIENNLEILSFVDRRLADLLRSKASERVLFESNAYAQRILDVINTPVEGELFPDLIQLFDSVVLGGLSGHAVPGLSTRKQNQPLGLSRAKRESVLLYDKGRDRFYSVEELAAMTPEEVSRLDISPDHPNWYDHDAFAAIRREPPVHFEQFMEDGISRMLRREGVLSAGTRYDMQTARRALFLDYIFDSATSPKGQATDAYGVTWKLKWGPESSVESVTWQLYMHAGSRITDIVLTNGAGPAEMILVLMDPAEAAAKPPVPSLRHPVTVDELKAASLDFYEFDLAPYIHSHGVITRDNVDALLRNLPAGGKSEYRKNRLIGRQWVAFRESCIELSTKGVLLRGDGVRLSDELAINDRVARGSFIFDMWVGNRDVKDDNSDSYFILDSSGERIALDGYREGRHDQGLTLGSLMAAGDLNGFDRGSEFARRGLFGKIRFKQSIVFKPESYETATWADGKWMARHLSAISEEEIRAAATASLWPDFAREALVYRLIDRRDRIAELFGAAGPSAYSAPTMTLALGTPEEIAAAERRYGLPGGALAAELARRGAGPGYAETVLKNGVITSAKKSALVCMLTLHLYPSGLASRYEILSGKGPAGCGAP